MVAHPALHALTHFFGWATVIQLIILTVTACLLLWQ